MLSVTQAAGKLKVTPSRVRKLIADGALKAEKIGNAWAIPESAVAGRLIKNPKAGRPTTQKTGCENEPEARLESKLESKQKVERTPINLHEAYIALKDGNFARPSASTIVMIKDKDEAGFILCVCDYFLNLKQREEIESGVF